MNNQSQDLWSNGKGAPLAFLVPGGTGTKRPAMKGYDAMASAFWLRGFSAQVFVSSGQDGRTGKYSMKGSLSEARSCLHELIDTLKPGIVILVGGCAGGALAAHLAPEISVRLLMTLWETPLVFSDESHREYVRRASQIGIPVADDYYSTTFNFIEAAPLVRCPVLFGYGSATNPPVFPPSDYARVEEALCNAVIEECSIPGANHDLPRGSSSLFLDEYLARVFAFLSRHGVRGGGADSNGRAG